MPYPEQLDLCDEIGLMVYEECQASWCLEDSPQMKTRFDSCVREMILRDRNHPSLTIWGVIVTTLAIASMCLNHLILPFYQPGSDRDIYRWLLWIRRSLIIAIILCGYGFYRAIGEHEELSTLSMTAYVATLQFMPGVLAVLYWSRGNRAVSG